MCCFSNATGNKETERSLFTIALFTDRKGKRFTNKLWATTNKQQNDYCRRRTIKS